MGYFLGNIEVRMVQNHEGGRVVWETLSPVMYWEDRAIKPVVIPSGTKTDGASIPWIFTWLYPSLDFKTFRPALVHDTLLRNREGRTRARIDGIFRRALRAEGVGSTQCFLMWAAVRIWATLTNDK